MTGVDGNAKQSNDFLAANARGTVPFTCRVKATGRAIIYGDRRVALPLQILLREGREMARRPPRRSAWIDVKVFSSNELHATVPTTARQSDSCSGGRIATVGATECSRGHLHRRIVEYCRTQQRAARRILPARLIREAQRLRDLPPAARPAYVWRLIRTAAPRPSSRIKFGRDEPLSILFVCHGNIMRSALAEALLASRIEGSEQLIVVRSAGLHALADAPADERMRNVGRALGVRLDDHRARAVSSESIAEATVVFVMDRLNDAELRARFPRDGHKVRLLGELVPSETDGIEIPDPYNGDEAAVRGCAARISACIGALIALLPKPSAC